MKKTTAIIVTLTMLFGLIGGMTASATRYYPNGTAEIPMQTHITENLLDYGTAWSDAVMLNAGTGSFVHNDNAMTSEAYIYMSYDYDGLYIAADITDNNTENSFVQSPTLSSVRADEEIAPTGDVFSFAIDPLGLFFENGYDSPMSYTAWYSIAMNDAGEMSMYRSRYNPDVITDEVSLNGQKTGYGWQLSVFVPWSMIIADAVGMSNGEVTCAASDLCELGAESRMLFVYTDRFYDLESHSSETWGQYMTSLPEMPDGSYTTTVGGKGVPTYGVTIKNSTQKSTGFGDTNPEAWYYNAAMWCNIRGYMNGTGDGCFSPNSNTTRAMFVAVLGKMDGINTNMYNRSSFDDVASNAWYTPYIEWAYINGIVSGYGNNFGPNDLVTREQMALFLYKYTQYSGRTAEESTIELTAFTDAGSVSAWALTAVKWAVANGFISGINENTLAPLANATRAQIARIVASYYSSTKE